MNRPIGPFWVHAYAQDLWPYRSFGIEVTQHGVVASSRHGAEIGIYLHLGRYRLHASIAKRDRQLEGAIKRAREAWGWDR